MAVTPLAAAAPCGVIVTCVCDFSKWWVVNYEIWHKIFNGTLLLLLIEMDGKLLVPSLAVICAL